MKSLKILIVEDEVLIGEFLKVYLEEENYEVLELCISYEEAVQSYNLHKPDLILLDIRLYGDKSGIDFAHYINQHERKAPYVFLTSEYDKRIIQSALDTDPYGYLIKPIQKESLYTTILSAYNLFSLKNETHEIVISEGSNSHKIDLNDILFIKAEHVYSEFHMKGGSKMLYRKSLSKLKESLNDQFLQIHRSYIINLKRVKSWNNQEVYIEDSIVPISRSSKADFLDRIKDMM